MIRLIPLLLFAASLWAQGILLTGAGSPSGAASIPVTFVSGTATTGTNVAMGTATGCAANTYCLNLPLASSSTGNSVLSNNLIYVAVMYASTGTNPTAKLGASSMTALSVSGAQSSKKVADFFIASATAGNPQITITSSAVKIFDVVVAQFAGVSGLDGTVKGTSNNTANNTLTGPSLTPLSGDLVVTVGCLAGTPNRTSFTAGTGTNITFTNAITDIGDGCALEYGTQGTSATYTPTYTTAGTASTYIVNAAAFTASTSTGTLPTGMYVANATEGQRPLTATQVAGGTQAYQMPSTGNLLLIQQACGNYQISSILDSGNTGWNVISATNFNTSATTTAYRSNAAADSSGLISVTYVAVQPSTGDCDGYLYDIHGADTVPLGNHMVISGNQGVAGSLTYTSGYLPGLSAGLQFATSSNGSDTISSISSPSSAVLQTATYGGQSVDGPSLPGQNNMQGTAPFSSNAAQTWTVGFSGGDAAGPWTFDAVSFRSSGTSLGIFGNQFLNSPTVAGSPGHLAVTLTPRTSTGVIWAFVAWDDSTHTMSCSDGTNGAYTAVDSPVNETVGGTVMRFQTFWVANTTTSSITPTCTVSSGGTITTNKAWLAVHEIIGVTTLDKHPVVIGGTATGTAGVCSATGTLATASEYIVTGIVVGTGERFTANFTNQQNYSAGSFGDASGDLVVNATTTFTPTWTLETSGDTYGCAVNTFK